MTLKDIHVASAVFTLLAFLLRGYWMLLDSPRLRHPLTRTLPHVIDTILFASGLALAIQIYGAFYREGWLLGKIGAVALYIVLGTLALKRGRTRVIRATALFGAVSVFAYIVLVAHSHSLRPF